MTSRIFGKIKRSQQSANRANRAKLYSQQMIAYRLFGGRWLLRLIMSLSWAQSSARSPSPARRMTSPGRRLHRHLTVLKADGTVVSKKIGAPPINVLATLKITVYLLN